VHETVHMDAWLVAKLKADVGAGGLFGPANPAKVNGVWSDVIAPDAVLPAIRFQEQGALDTNGVSGQRILVRGTWLVVVTGKTKDYGPLVPAADRLDEVLQRASGNTSGVWVLQCTRIAPFKQTDPGDIQFRHLGGLYEIIGHKQ